MIPEQNFIDGKLTDCTNCKTIPITTPSTDEVIGEIYDTPDDLVNQAIAAAKKAQPVWEKSPAIIQANYLTQIAQKSEKMHMNLPMFWCANRERPRRLPTSG